MVMGVSGSGKTTIGELLSRRLGWSFYDGDDFHPPENIDKMRRGIPLDDRDRQMWLLALLNLIEAIHIRKEPAVIASSALKESYRQYLSPANGRSLVWVYLKGSYEQIEQRLKARQGHFMKADMLRSQFETLEEPDRALKIDISLSQDAIVDRIVTYLENLHTR
jgi:gluconokinase